MHVQVSFNSCRALLDHSAAADHAEAMAGPSQPRCIRPCDLPHNFAAGLKTKKKQRSLSCLEIVHGGQHGHSEHFWRTEFTVHHNIERLTLVDASKGYKGVSMYTHA